LNLEVRGREPHVRTFVGFLIAAVALAGAVYLHSGVKAGTKQVTSVEYGQTSYFGNSNDRSTVVYDVKARASWQDPVAIFLAVAGIGAGAGVLLRR
jgi:hypothetical protein